MTLSDGFYIKITLSTVSNLDYGGRENRGPVLWGPGGRYQESGLGNWQWRGRMGTRIKILTDAESTGVCDLLNLGEEAAGAVGHNPKVPGLAD